MKLLNKIELNEKRSRFIAYYYEISKSDSVKDILSELKKEHKKARHFVYAYKIDNEIKKHDAKEPKNSAGQPILNIINHNDLNNVLIVVVRYFGGTLLGVGKLGRMYSVSASEVIKKRVI